MQGHLFHEKVHKMEREKRRDLIRVRGLRISSARLGLSGQTDLVEFHRAEIPRICTSGQTGSSSGDSAVEGKEKSYPRGLRQLSAVKLPGVTGFWRVFPVEYKRGRPKRGNADKVQLCAQAMCLEEMLETHVSGGALFYGASHRRLEVAFDSALRTETENVARAIHQMVSSGSTPPPDAGPKCRRCSLIDLCMPQQFDHRRRKIYIDRIFSDD